MYSRCLQTSFQATRKDGCICVPICRPCLDSRLVQRRSGAHAKDKESVKDGKTAGVIAHDIRFTYALEVADLRLRWVRVGVGGYVSPEARQLKTVEELEGYGYVK